MREWLAARARRVKAVPHAKAAKDAKEDQAVFFLFPLRPSRPWREANPRIDLPRVARKLTRMSSPIEFKSVTAVAKANVYFDGKVVSHSILFPDGSKKTLGLIYAGQFHFGTDQAERMEIIAGACTVKLDGQTAPRDYAAGTAFDVPAKSGFDIEVRSGLCEYVCSFLG